MAAALTCSRPAAATSSTPGPSQSELACGGALFLAHEAHHARDDQEEEKRRSHDQHEDVGVAERLVEADAGRDQARPGEQPEAERSETRARVERRLFERAHRGVERGRAPEEVEGNPADVVAELMVVRLRQQGERVCGVHGEEGDDAPDQKIEGGCPLAVVDRQADCGGEEQDVAERVGGRNRLLERRQAGEVDVRSDQEDPREQRDADRDDQRVDHAGAVALWVPPPDEQRAGPRRARGRRSGRWRPRWTGTPPRRP